MNLEIPLSVAVPIEVAQKTPQTGNQSQKGHSTEPDLASALATANYARILTHNGANGAAATLPPSSEASVLQQLSNDALNQVAGELLRVNYTPKTTQKLVSDVSTHRIQPPAAPTLKRSSRSSSRSSISAQTSRPSSMQPPPLSDKSIKERNARLDLSRWGFASQTLDRISVGEQSLVVRNEIAQWRKWAREVGISTGFVTLIFTQAIHRDAFVDAIAQFQRFSSLPFQKHGARVGFDPGDLFFDFSEQENGVVLKLRGYETSLLLTKPSGIFVLWTAAILWKTLSSINLSFHHLCHLSDSQQGVDTLITLSNVALDLYQAGFLPHHLSNILLSSVANQKLQYAYAYRAVVAGGAMSAQEFVQLCFDDSVGLPDLMCTLMERGGQLVYAQSA